MPSYEFRGFVPMVYTGTRDASGHHLGLVEPGDIRILDDPPTDGMWVPVIPPRDDSGEGEGGTGSDPDPDGTQAPDPGAEGDAGKPEPHDTEPGEPEAPDA